MNFSVCICVYDKDNHKYLKEALESIYNQSVKPNQIVLVLDGPINQELETVIKVIEQAAKTDQIGDGKIFVTDLSKVIRIRTGETGPSAI